MKINSANLSTSVNVDTLIKNEIFLNEIWNNIPRTFKNRLYWHVVFTNTGTDLLFCSKHLALKWSYKSIILKGFKSEPLIVLPKKTSLVSPEIYMDYKHIIKMLYFCICILSGEKKSFSDWTKRSLNGKQNFP